MKRPFDLVAAGVGLILLSPALLAIALIIKLTDRGPICYVGRRVGRFGKPFGLLKFRSMVLNADKIGGPSTADDDPRITKIGLFLRKYKLDELPQLINVIKGEMSLVGPRPEVQEYVDLFTEEEKEILSARPGITDWASLWNPDEGAVLAGSDDPEKTYLEKIRPQKVKLQLEYVRKRSMWVDWNILIQTFAAVVFKSKPKALEVLEENSVGNGITG